MNWIVSNFENIVLAVTSLVTAASVIAKLTPSTHDDKFVDMLLKFTQWLSINGTPPAPPQQ